MEATLEEIKQRGAAWPATDEPRALYRKAFAKYGPRALWSSRPGEKPTIADLLAITESLRVEGGVEGRRLAVRIETACRAALSLSVPCSAAIGRAPKPGELRRKGGTTGA